MRRRLEYMRRNPQAGWRMDDIQAVCREYGIKCEKPRGGGSHYKVSHEAVTAILTVPFKRPIKPVYIRKLVAFIDGVRKGS